MNQRSVSSWRCSSPDPTVWLFFDLQRARTHHQNQIGLTRLNHLRRFPFPRLLQWHHFGKRCTSCLLDIHDRLSPFGRQWEGVSFKLPQHPLFGSVPGKSRIVHVFHTFHSPLLHLPPSNAAGSRSSQTLKTSHRGGQIRLTKGVSFTWTMTPGCSASTRVPAIRPKSPSCTNTKTSAPLRRPTPPPSRTARPCWPAQNRRRRPGRRCRDG